MVLSKIIAAGCVVLLVVCVAYGDARGEGTFAYNSKGKRDPFMPLLGHERQAGSPEDISTIDDVKLEGIAVQSEGKRIAIINGIVAKEGDKIGALQVNKISPKKVQVVIDGRDYELALAEKEAR